jgi:hypothetical protein
VPWVDLDMVGRSTPLPCHDKLFQISSCEAQDMVVSS